jgi:mercuric ion transport protein
MSKAKYTGIGSIVASFLAASCCVGPAIFVIFGTSAGFFSKLSFLEKYRPYLLGAAFLMLGYSFVNLYIRKPSCDCAEDIRNRKIARGIFWVGLVAVVFSLTFRKIILWIYG